MKKTKLGMLSLLMMAMVLLFTGCGNETVTKNVKSIEQVESSEDDANEVKTATENNNGEVIPKSKNITVEIADKEGNVTSYEATTEAEFLYDAIKEMEEIKIEGTEGEYGLYIDSVNGIVADYETDNAYWSLYVNGEYGQYSISEQPIADGDVYKIAYEVAVVE